MSENPKPLFNTWSPCSSHATRETLWVSSNWNQKNGDGRPSAHVAWGVSSSSISGKYADTYALDVRK